MKLLIVLFAVVVAVSAYPGHPWAAPVVSQPWPDPWQASAWPAPAPVPKYIKVAVPVAQVHAQVHAPAVHHVINVPQPAPIPPVHPQPLNIKVPHSQSVRIPYHGVHISQPHLVGVEHYVPEPEVKVVAKPVAHHPW
ncbi:cyclin-dependent kinase inhibitor 1C-like [Vespula squamosa]|uniref:Cyclin-dependent kinase inhibitor 1C-like n=1 Tax=Vespula squamosa TaxID=30214 RepID=A0ABD2BYY1_VESSQ